MIEVLIFGVAALGLAVLSGGVGVSTAASLAAAAASPDGDGGDVLEQWAKKNQVSPALLRAILKVESGPLAPVDAAGNPLARFEVHSFLEQLRQAGVPEAKVVRARQYFRHGSPPWTGQEWRPAPAGTWRKLRGDGIPLSENHRALTTARSVALQLAGSEEPALRAASWGIGQVMGFHAPELGYASARAMVDEAKKGRSAQERIWIRFMERKPGVLKALQSGDLLQVARAYNGSGQPETYATKLARQGAPSRRIA